MDSRPAATRRGAHPAETQRFSSAYPPARQSVEVLLTVLLVTHRISFAFHRIDSQPQLLTVSLMTHQSSAVNSARSTVPPLLNLTLSCWYAEDSPPGSSLLISTVLVALDSPICCAVPVQARYPDFLWIVWQCVHCRLLVRSAEDGCAPIGTPPLPSHGYSMGTCYWHPS